MKSAWRMSLILLVLPALLAAQAKKKPTTPAAFSNATYAWVESVDGDVYRPGLLPEDRQAISDVEEALRKWKRYSLTATKNEAELLFIVRKGRLVSAHVGVGLGDPTFPGHRPAGTGTAGTARGVGVGGEAGPRDDMLEVYLRNSDGTPGLKLWERFLTDGLDAPQVPLMAELRKAVEKDYPRNPPAKP